MNRNLFASGAAVLLLLAVANTAEASRLTGSPASMRQQHGVAVQEDYAFLRNAAQVREVVDSGDLHRLEGNADYQLAKVSFPFARTEVRLFIERLAAQYRAATGSRLIVTSLLRPSSAQPSNAHKLSVHPTGIAVDFRVPQDAKSRQWLEATLLQLETSGVLDATLERNPPHYHVAVFPKEYSAYMLRIDSARAIADARRARDEAVAISVGEPAAVAIKAADVSRQSASSGRLSLLLGIGAGIFPVLLIRGRARKRNGGA